MFSSLPVPGLAGLFLLAALIVWVAGIYLAEATDVVAVRWGLGEALGGLVILAVVTNLPEIAITASGAWRGDLDVAVGNLLGGIAVQTVVLVLLDALGKGTPLMARSASPALMIEAVLVMIVLTVAMLGSRLPASLAWGGLFPPDGAILLLWMGGLFFVGRLRKSPQAAQAGTRPRGHARQQRAKQARERKRSTAGYVWVLLIGGLATLLGGVVLEGSGKALADHWGVSGVVFGATVLALATSLPEISTGWASIRLGDDQMAVSDIFGGNAFLPVLFLEASLLSGQAVLPKAKPGDLYLAALGLLLTAVYLAALIFRPKRRVVGLGVDSLLVLVLYGAGVAGLLAF